MKLYLNIRTNLHDVVIDFIEIKLRSGEIVNVTWDKSEISREKRDDIDITNIDTLYRGIYFDGKYANGRLDDLIGLEMKYISIYSEQANSGDFDLIFNLCRVEFTDGNEILTIIGPECKTVAFTD